MGTTIDHRRCAEGAEDDQDKALWLTLAQSWVRLAEHAERSTSSHYLELEAERAS